MPAKSQQLQIRVSAREKAQLKRRAHAAGLDVSSYVLARALPPESERFTAILRAAAHAPSPRFALAELHDLLASLSAAAFADATDAPDRGAIDECTPYLRNYVAAMVEHTAHQLGVAPPGWVHSIRPMPTPHFATPFVTLRPHLLRNAPVAFKRRNIFIDSTVGDRT